MYRPSIFALLAVAMAFVSAVPYATNTTNTTNTTTTITAANNTNTTTTLPDGPTDEYYLVTQIIDYGNEDKNGLYVSGYHTGRDLTPSFTLHDIAMSRKADQE